MNMLFQGYDNTGQLDGKPEADDEVQFSDDEQVRKSPTWGICTV